MYSSSPEKILRLLKTGHLLQEKGTLIYLGLMTNHIKRGKNLIHIALKFITCPQDEHISELRIL